MDEKTMDRKEAGISPTTITSTSPSMNNNVVDFECQVCCQKWKEESDFVRHSFNHVEESLEKMFSENEVVKGIAEQDKSSENEIRYECDSCKKKFTQKLNLKFHLARFCCSSLFTQCSHCYDFFSSKSCLQKHCRERQFFCNFCKRHFKSKKLLNRHVKCHSNVCSKCGAIFKHQDSLNFHISSVHSDKRPFKCDQCDASFKRKHGLSNHILSVHSEERPFKCEICDSSFKLEANWTLHVIKVHKDLKPFKCLNSECHEAFRTKWDLRKHARRHSLQRESVE